MNNKAEILIFGADSFELLDEKKRQAKLPVDDLRKNLDAFMAFLKDVLPSVDSAGVGFGLKTLTVAVGINGKGQVGFFGNRGRSWGDCDTYTNF